ncbi:MAG: EAL domain-containing protein [Vicinamibacteria bacterium]|nr:EAL domain-containing protein [Vicinamibacteria bacterium]
MTSLLDRILTPGELSVVFQPILEVRNGSRALHALECLIRGPRGTNLEPAEILLEYARRKREECRVDRACLSTAFMAASMLQPEARLCINVHASTLSLDAGLPRFIDETARTNRIDPSRLTVEIIEHLPACEEAVFLRALDSLREIGIKIALDDIGLGQSNYKMILDARPDYFKVDRYLVMGAYRDSRRQAILESIVRLAVRLDARVVAEGVEDALDLATVLSMGIDLIQGHLLSEARPLPEFAASPRVAGVCLRHLFTPTFS